MSTCRLLTRISLITAVLLSTLAACSERGPNAQGRQGHPSRPMSSAEREKMVTAQPIWRKQAESAVGYSKPCRAAMSANFERCFNENWEPKRAALGTEFADCINTAAGADVTCIVAGRYADGTFSLDASPLAPP